MRINKLKDEKKEGGDIVVKVAAHNHYFNKSVLMNLFFLNADCIIYLLDL